MIVSDYDREVIQEYARRFIKPLLSQTTEHQLGIPINLDGANSPQVALLTIGSGKGVLQEVTDNGSRVILVYKPDKKDSYRNFPTPTFIRGLQDKIDKHIESEGSYSEKGKGLSDVPYNQLPVPENAIYVGYNDHTPESEFGFSAASADNSGIYLVKSQSQPTVEKNTTNSDKLERLQAHAFRHILETALEEELYKRELVNLAEEVANKVSQSTLIYELNKNNRIQTHIPLYAESHATYWEDGNLDISVQIFLYTGHRGIANGTQDARYLKAKLESLKTLSHDGLSLSLEDKYARINPINAGARSPKGELMLKSTHLVTITYRGSIPSEMQWEFYQKHRNDARN